MVDGVKVNILLLDKLFNYLNWYLSKDLISDGCSTIFCVYTITRGILLQLLEIAVNVCKVCLTVLQTDTSSWVEDTKALGRTMLKELGKITL